MKSTKPGIPPEVQQVIQHAGLNKPEMVKAIGYFVADNDSMKRKALYCLMAQMDKNYTVYYSVQDTLGNHYSFNPKDYPDYLSLKHAWDSTEQIRGNLIYHADSFRIDDQLLSGNYLINNINEAFKAHKDFPWSKNYSFQTFCHWILPYRVANEQPEAFRQYFLTEYGSLPQKFYDKNVHTLDVAMYINKLINQKVDYKDTYNKSLNIQAIRQLEKSGFGNFYDINIYKVKVLRAFGIAATMDYVPFLADTNFGYAYTTVILPGRNELTLGYNHGVKALHKPGRLAKVYRRTFFRDSSSLYTIKKLRISTPPFLGDFYYSDITNRLQSANVWLRLNGNAKYAYLAVFNDGGWHPISWATPKDSVVLFKKMGKQIVYLPVSYQKHILMRLGLPFILDSRGIKHFLKADFSFRHSVTLRKTSPHEKISPGEVYTLYFWDGNWKSLTSFRAGKRGYTLAVPTRTLLLLTNDDIDFNERIFIINSKGRQQFY
ncbi:hypothetical protein MNBD_BACTEROID07-1928 [hydrothermal vent metagenome]|uniref:Uncharacterized protein n=1 Tax=hydrothermal vent metagenome TaxID=652676 RepID=A0A3B0VCX6_9ZZZZ